jgi:hypothetical protein
MQLTPITFIATAFEINASNDSVVYRNSNLGLQTFPTTTKGIFLKHFQLPNLPQNLEEQKIYFVKTADSFTRIYTTQEDAEAGTNYYNFTANDTTGYLFQFWSPFTNYPAMTCWHPAAAELENVVCCPPVPEVYTNCPNQAATSYKSESVTLYNFTANNYYGALNTTTPVIKNFTDSGGTTNVLNSSFSFYFKDYSDGTVFHKPTLIINFEATISGVFAWYGAATYTTTFDYSSTITLSLVKLDISATYRETLLTAQGFLPATITLTFSGEVLPPPQIKVHMPDAYFENKAAPINLGLVEETLTYDAATLTYWSDLKTYAGIKGRLHFAIPNFYPLTSSGIEFIDSGYKFENQFLYGGSVLYPLGSFPDEMLNTFSNADFDFYATVSVSHVYVYELSGQSNSLRLFTANDNYGGYLDSVKGYPTGLGLGQTWFDSRVIRNMDPASTYALRFGPEFIHRVPAKIVIAFSKWASGKFLKSNELGSGLGENPGNLNHYKQSAYFVQSVHPNAHVTSLGL